MGNLSKNIKELYPNDNGYYIVDKSLYYYLEEGLTATLLFHHLAYIWWKDKNKIDEYTRTTIKQIADYFKVSKSSVHRKLQLLIDKELIITKVDNSATYIKFDLDNPKVHEFSKRFGLWDLQ